MNKLRTWLRSWALTLYIKYRNPELYRQLREPLTIEDDFGEATPPGE